MPSISRMYFDQVVDILDNISTNQTDALNAATDYVVTALKSNKLIYVV